MSQNNEQHGIRWKLLLIVALASVTLLAAVMATTAWLTSDRSLTTLTKINFETLTLTGKTNDSMPVNLGELKKGETKEMPFRIVTEAGSSYCLQLAHTTNLPLKYEIYTAAQWYENGVDRGDCIKAADVEEKQDHSQTYGDYSKVQKYAEPYYWTSKARTAETGIDYYVLVVSWKENVDFKKVINKDTEMIYLSASLKGETQDAQTPTTQP